MRGSIISVLLAVTVIVVGTTFAAETAAQSALSPGAQDAPPISDEMLDAISSTGTGVANVAESVAPEFAPEFSGDVSGLSDSTTAGVIGDSSRGAFPVFGTLPVGHVTRPNF